MTIKTYGFVNSSNVVTNVLLIDDAESHEHFLRTASICHAEKWYDTENYGFAVVGGTFENDKFYPVKPFPSWVWQDTIDTEDVKIEASWVPPKPFPTLSENQIANWNEDALDWVIINVEA